MHGAASDHTTCLASAPSLPQVEDDPLGRGHRPVHGSMYRDLRTNLPREVRPVIFLLLTGQSAA